MTALAAESVARCPACPGHRRRYNPHAMSVQKRTSRRADGSTETSWRVRWQEGELWRSRTFDRKRDADVFDGDLRRRRRLGTLAEIDAGTETLDTYVTQTWTPVYASTLAPKTRRTYASHYDAHISPHLGSTPLRELNSELIGRWQADRLRKGAGPVAVGQALGLLGNILQRAHEAGRIPTNSNDSSVKHADRERPRCGRSHPRRSRRSASRLDPGTRCSCH